MLEIILYGLYTLLMALTVFAAVKLAYEFRRFERVDVSDKKQTEGIKSLPSVTVCIPARNETHAMTDCLGRVIASTYQKLEIIVLDDSSADNTSALIKSFASEGVRFVEGSLLPHGWLGKNHALHHLLQEASGKYVLFMDVDTRIMPDTITNLVLAMTRSEASMISVLPRRSDGLRWSVIFGTLRYFWVLLMHRPNSPAVASSAWMIDRETLEDMGGLESYKADIQPESKLASQLLKSGKYSFLTESASISYEKKWSSQVDTSVRLLPSIFGASIASNIAILLVMFLLNAPSVVVLTFPVYDWTLMHWLASLQIIFSMAIYGFYTKKVWKRGWWIGALLWPIIIFQELVILMISIYENKTHSVTWKGRKVKIEPAVIESTS